MAPEMLYYDGDCGLCHRTVRMVLALDRSGEAFRFAPLDGPTFRQRIDPARAAELPDSIVLERDDGVLLLRSEAVIHVLRRLGGPWRLLAGLVALVPVGLRDRVYDAVARNRARLFQPPGAACPVVPPPLRARFDP